MTASFASPSMSHSASDSTSTKPTWIYVPQSFVTLFCQPLNSDPEAAALLQAYAGKRIAFGWEHWVLLFEIDAQGQWQAASPIDEVRHDMQVQLKGADWVFALQGPAALQERLHISGEAGLMQAVNRCLQQIDLSGWQPSDHSLTVAGVSQGLLWRAFKYSVQQLHSQGQMRATQVTDYLIHERQDWVRQAELTARQSQLLALGDTIARLEARLQRHPAAPRS